MINNISYNPYVRTLDNSGNVINKNASLPTHSERSCANMSFRDLVETVEAAQAEQVKKCNLEIEQVGVADISKRTEPEYTTCITALDGNPNHPNIEKINRQINIGMEYKKSCFDFTFSKDFAQMKADEEAVGYENMTAAEKYETVYNRYTHCYGENFLDAFMLSYPSPAQEDPYRQIVDNFYSEIEQLCGSREAGMQARREMLYGDMSDYDVRNSIIEEHCPDEEMTFRDFYSMTYDMELCGVGGDVHYWISEIFDGYGYYLNDGNGFYQERRDEMLDSTVTSEHLNFMQNNYYGRIYSGGSVNPEFGAVLSQVMATFGV